jgi:hypothetical protein
MAANVAELPELARTLTATERGNPSPLINEPVATVLGKK